MPKKSSQERRRVLKALLATSLASVAAPILYVVGRFVGFTGAANGAAIAKLSVDDLSPATPSKLVQINGAPIIVLRNEENQIRAFTATCTHLGCTVSYRPTMADLGGKPGFYCKCHKGEYNENGINVPGTRPKKPLTELTVNENADQIEVTLKPKKVA